MSMKKALLAIATAAAAGCAPNPTVMDPAAGDRFPAASESAMTPCPDNDPDGAGVLHDAADASRAAVLEARAKDGRAYALCRQRHEALIEHERERLRQQREEAAAGQ